MIKVALVDDHVILRKSLAVLIGMLNRFKVVLESSNGKEFINSLTGLDKNDHPDIVLMDITMPVMDGIETTYWLKKNKYHNIKVIALSMIKNELVIIRMLNNGARGYLLKDCEPYELKRALLDVYNNGYYFNEFVTPNKDESGVDEKADITKMINEKEIEFLRLACSEKSYKEIADDMGFSPRTIDGYRDALFRKINVNTRVGLVLFALKSNIVQL